LLFFSHPRRGSWGVFLDFLNNLPPSLASSEREVVWTSRMSWATLRHKQPNWLLREVQMTRSLRIHSIRQIGRLLQSQRVRPTTVVLALFFLMPVAVLAQGSPFDTGFTAIQSLFTGTIAKVASLVAAAHKPRDLIIDIEPQSCLSISLLPMSATACC
jgi:hypothetical protein